MGRFVHLHPRMISDLLYCRPVFRVIHQTLTNQVLQFMAEVEVVINLYFHDILLKVWIVLG